MSGVIKGLLGGGKPKLPPQRDFAKEEADRKAAEETARQEKLDELAKKRRKGRGRLISRKTGALGVVDENTGSDSLLF